MLSFKSTAALVLTAASPILANFIAVSRDCSEIFKTTDAKVADIKDLYNCTAAPIPGPAFDVLEIHPGYGNVTLGVCTEADCTGVCVQWPVEEGDCKIMNSMFGEIKGLYLARTE